jgi:hypothetical protein
MSISDKLLFGALAVFFAIVFFAVLALRINTIDKELLNKCESYDSKYTGQFIISKDGVMPICTTSNR